MKTLKHTLSALFAVVASIVMLPAMADLPSGYRQLDYVDTDGSQWVNTLFRPTCTKKIGDSHCLPRQLSPVGPNSENAITA